MNYDFTSIIDRSGKDALAVEAIDFAGTKLPVREGFARIPMWVADMNFATAPGIQEAVINRVNHPLFGYFNPSAQYYKAITDWMEKRHGIKGIECCNIGYENGVLGGLISAVNVLCSKGDNILLHAPTYIGFTICLRNNGYNLILSPLKKDKDGIWRMDYEDMEDKIRKNCIHTAIFCSPHNPSGRVWERWEIEKAMEIYKKHNVFVVSDEIWADLTLNGNRHIPVQSVSEDARERTFALYAPSKTFNLAGLIGAYHIVYNEWMRERIDKEASLSHYNKMNVLSMHALIGAYTPQGHVWVDELRDVLSANVNYAVDYINSHFEGVEVSKPQGTYMLFIDCTNWCKKHNKNIETLYKLGVEYGVIWQDGRLFNGNCHIRMNLALPFSLVKEAFERLDKYVFNA
ncbi:MalY/PatB family protein [Johnsonella ignava]|uniref:MalY/PatB family protein n=1 Tax=Johnsonella ignava TaxID=43995 RepID=UPI0023F0113D|nr:aminotransferase class I/II-fold pyridoxal phosphate-dependent enzyme [Johnsonella ignava]